MMSNYLNKECSALKKIEGDLRGEVESVCVKINEMMTQ